MTIITDGVSGPMPANEIVSIINSRDSAHDSARHLVDSALLLGTVGNINKCKLQDNVYYSDL